MAREKRGGSALFVALVVAAAFLVPAGILVVRSIGRVKSGPLPPALSPVNEDSALVGGVRRLGYRLYQMDKRLDAQHARAGRLTAEQAALFAAAESGMGSVRAVLAVLETLTDQTRRRHLLDSGTRLYDSARADARRFAATLGQPESEAESLDEELKQVLGR
jgi:hypothetical protein